MHETTLKIVRDRFPRISEVLNDCSSIPCISTYKDESLASILKKICARISEIESPAASEECCYTFEDSDTVTFSISEDNVVTAEAIGTGDGSVTSVSLEDITDFALATGNPLVDSGSLGYSLIAQPAATF